MTEIKKLPNSRIVLDLHIDSEEIAKYKNESLGMLGQNAKIEGFRKGKAPLNILRDNIDKEKWLIETVDLAINSKYYQAAVEIKDKYLVIGNPKIDFKSKIDFDSIDKGIDFVAEVDVYPEVVLPDYAKIEVEKDKVDITDDDFEKSKELLLKKRSTLKEMEKDYSAKNGDWIDVDFEVEIEGEKVADAGTKRFPLIIGNKIMADGFEEKLIDHKAGDEFDFVLDISKDYREKNLAGKKVKFYVKINDIKQLVLPNFDDDFVKGLAIKGVASVDDFKKYWLNNLQQEKEKEEEEKVKNNILNLIEKDTTIELPESLVVQELDMMWHEFEHNLQDKGISTQDYLKRENIEISKIKEGWKEQATKRVRFGLIIRELIKRLDVKVGEEEINAFLENRMNIIKEDLARHAPENASKLEEEYRKRIFSDDYKRQAEQELIIDNMFDKLKKIMMKNN